jgi:uncharacterized protein Usg
MPAIAHSSGTHVILPRASLVTAEILYRRPDFPGLLQSFVWQTRDEAPEFPRVREFLAWWSRTLDGVLHSVRVVDAGAKPASWRYSGSAFTLEGRAVH